MMSRALTAPVTASRNHQARSTRRRAPRDQQLGIGGHLVGRRIGVSGSQSSARAQEAAETALAATTAVGAFECHAQCGAHRPAEMSPPSVVPGGPRQDLTARETDLAQFFGDPIQSPLG